MLTSCQKPPHYHNFRYHLLLANAKSDSAATFLLQAQLHPASRWLKRAPRDAWVWDLGLMHHTSCRPARRPTAR
jgi:hypothetical protein